jgi:threonine dehydrogenase-like Zn-dependent dehydrogenase
VTESGLTISADGLAEKEVAIMGNHSSPGMWNDLVVCTAANRYKPKTLIGRVLPLEQVEEAFKSRDSPKELTQTVVLSML